MMRFALLLLAVVLTTSSSNAFLTAPTTTKQPTVLYRPPLQMCDFFEGFMNLFSSSAPQGTANASHILMKGGPEALQVLEDLKNKIGNDPILFSDAAAKFSDCPSASKGGNLGDFGPGQMVKQFDKVVFKSEVGVVHGPIKTEFGYHLILINERRSG